MTPIDHQEPNGVIQMTDNKPGWILTAFGMLGYAVVMAMVFCSFHTSHDAIKRIEAIEKRLTTERQK